MTPIVSFYRVLASGLPPARATRSALGQLPVKGYRFCEAVTSASGFGWYIFPPIGFRLETDGEMIAWAFDDGSDDWYALEDGIQYPGASEAFDAAAPQACRSYTPPWLVRGNTPGLVQIWTGIIIVTAPSWSVLVRAPANLGRSQGYELLEGIVETDNWVGPLFTNIKLIGTDQPYRFPAHHPILQVQPIPRSLYSDETLNAVEVLSVDQMTGETWDGYHRSIVLPAQDPARPLGSYAVAVRKRRARERR